MRLVIDTNAYIGFMRGEVWAVAPIQQAAQLLVPVIVLAELRAGFNCGIRDSRNEEVLARFLNVDRVHVVEVDEASTHIYARLFAFLRKGGTPIPTNDLWIAALTMQHNAILLTQDGHFGLLPQVARHA